MRPYVTVTDQEILGKIAREIENSPVIALDLETAKIGGGGSLDPLTGRIRLCSINTGENRYVIDLYKTGTLGPVETALKRTNAVVVGQNVKFDQKWLLWHYGIEIKKPFDTFRASHIYYAGLPGLKHDLWALYKRELKESPEVDDLGGSDWDGTLDQKQLDYAADDVDKLLRLREVLRQKIIKADLVKTAQLEFNVILPESLMELNGFGLDEEMWRKRTAEDTQKAADLREKLLSTLPDPSNQVSLPGFGSVGFNVDSPDQVLRSLQKLGIKQKIKDPDTGITRTVPLQDTKEMTLAMVADKFPVLTDFIEYRGYSKQSTAFGLDYLKHQHPTSSRIHCSYFPYTDSGRYACIAPWTPVRTSEGLKPIVEVKVGDKVWTHKERWRSVKAFLPQGTLQTYNVRFCNGHVLTCSGNHRILLSSGRWITVGEVYERFSQVDNQQGKSGKGTESVSQPRAFSHDRHSEAIRDNGTQHTRDHSSLFARSGEEGSCRTSVLGVERRVEEPDVREVRRGTPQLDRGMRGWAWLPDLSLGGKASLRPSCSNDGVFGDKRTSAEDRRTPHRRGSEEQLDRQSRTRDNEGTPSYSLFTGEGQPVVSIEEVHLAGRIEVYDLTVEEDESYETLGIFSHNCRSPNLQQIPRGKAFRDCFRGAEGTAMAICDWSNIEMRLVAEISGDPTLIKVFQEGRDAHYATAALVTGKPESEVTKTERQQAKAVNFGFIYGMQAKKLVQYAKSSYGVTLTDSEARKFRQRFFEAYEGIASWHEYSLDRGKRRRETRTLWGRRRILKDERAHNEFLNSPVQGSGADGLKRTLRVVYDKLKELNGGEIPLLGKGAVVGMVHMVHDEIILEHKDDPDLAPLVHKSLQDGMIEGISPMMPRVPVEAEVEAGRSWAAK